MVATADMVVNSLLPRCAYKDRLHDFWIMCGVLGKDGMAGSRLEFVSTLSYSAFINAFPLFRFWSLSFFLAVSVPGCLSWMTGAIYVFFATTLAPHLFLFCKGKSCKKSIFSKSKCRRAKGLWAERCDSRMPGHLVEVMICCLHTLDCIPSEV